MNVWVYKTIRSGGFLLIIPENAERRSVLIGGWSCGAQGGWFSSDPVSLLMMLTVSSRLPAVHICYIFVTYLLRIFVEYLLRICYAFATHLQRLQKCEI